MRIEIEFDENKRSIVEKKTIKINNKVVIASDCNERRELIIHTPKMNHSFIHGSKIRSIGFIDNTIVFLDDNNELWKVIWFNDEVGYQFFSLDIINKLNPCLLISTGDMSMVKTKDNKYFNLTLKEGPLEVERVSRTKFDRAFNRAKYLDSYLDKSSIIFKIG